MNLEEAQLEQVDELTRGMQDRHQLMAALQFTMVDRLGYKEAMVIRDKAVAMCEVARNTRDGKVEI